MPSSGGINNRFLATFLTFVLTETPQYTSKVSGVTNSVTRFRQNTTNTGAFP